MASPEVISEQRHMIRGLSRTVTGQNIRIVKVKVVQGLNLAKKDIFGLSDPYCMIKLFGSSRHTDNIVTLQTPVRKKTLNPKWNSSFSLRVNTEDHSLSFEIYDENRITRDDFLGEVIVSLKNIPEEEGSSAALPPKDYLLQGRSQKSRVKGHIRVSLVLQREEAATNNTLDESDGIAARHIRNDLNSGESYPSGSSVAPERPDEPGWEAVNHEDVEENIAEISRQPSVSFSEIEPLPEGWEERQDANGRTFYVNHNTRSTTWVRPTALSDANAIETSNNDVSELARSFSYRRHISVEAAAGPSTAVTGLPPGWEERRNANGQVLYIDHNSRTTSWVRPRSQSHLNDDAPPTSDSVESQRQRRISERLHPDVPSQSEMALPAGWAMQLADNGRVFFIDHNSRKTCWVDPRINPQEIDAADLGPLPAGWEERVHSDGRVFFIDHDTQSTQWEDPRLQIKAKEKSEAVPYSRDYKRKYDYFRSRLKRPEKVPNKYEIHVRRTSLLDDSYGFVLSRCTNVDLLKTKLWIVFEGEVGLDYGGVQREWFYVLSKEIFNPYYGLFEYSASDNYTLQINPYSGLCNDQHLSYFKFIGRVAGMAMYHGKLLDGFFIRPFYKMMLGKKITLQDMESVDSEYHNSLKYLIDNDPEDLELYFQVEEETFGQIVATELKPGGENIRVTNSNKQEYIDLVIKWRFNDRVAEQMKSFMEGLEDLIPLQLLQLFDENEIEYLLCGLGEIDVDDWRKNTIYRNGYHDKHVVVTWFWKAVSNFDNEMKARLLQFVTGTSRVPMNGFAELYGSNGPQKFAIERWGNSHQLPKSHTCFNRIDLPQYNSYHELREKLRLAIENTEGFDGVD